MSDLARKRDTDSKFDKFLKMGGPHLKVVDLFGNFKLKFTNLIKNLRRFQNPKSQLDCCKVQQETSFTKNVKIRELETRIN